MKTMTVGEFKARFSEAMEAVRQGETVVVCYGRGRRKIAAMVPYASIRQPRSRPLGLLRDSASVSFPAGFALNDQELLAD
jgi:antitoxin (DNA-binding transcriptional repressor) of toxin-antitoxin stability system